MGFGLLTPRVPGKAALSGIYNCLGLYGNGKYQQYCFNSWRRISSSSGVENGLKIEVDGDGDTIVLPLMNALDELELFKLNRIWLRHHCRCPLCFNSVTYQRRVTPTRSIFPNSKIEKLEYQTNAITVHWQDEHESSYNLDWLARHVPRAENTCAGIRNYRITQAEWTTKKSVQHADSEKSVEDNAIDYAAFMKNDFALTQFFRNIIQTGFGMVRFSPSDLDSISQVHRRICHPHRTFYGDGVIVATSDMKYNDTAYSSEPLALHTDTTYFTEPLGLQSFHVLHHEGTGGLSSFSDGFHAAKLLHAENKEMYSALATIPVPGEYFDPGKFNYSSIGHTFSHNLCSGVIERIRFNPMDMGVLTQIHPDKLTLFYEAMVRFTELLEQHTLWFKLRPGTTLFIDNWRVLHGRSGFTGKRSLATGYFPRSDWQSRARIVGALEQ